jgi:CRP-like cAMP-binding protein
MDAEQLSTIELFAGLSQAQLAQVAAWSDEIDVDTGYHLIRRDGFGYEFFVILEGDAETMDGDRHLSDLHAGDYFGEIALLDLPRRSAAVRATSPMRLLVMSRQSFRSMMDSMPPVADRIRVKAEERLANSAIE